MEGYKQVPYVVMDGVPTFKDSDLKKIYEKIQLQQLIVTLFHDGSVNNEADFIQMVKAPGTLFWVIMDQDSNPVAIWWLNRLTKSHAWCHFVLFKEAWGTSKSDALGKEAMQICFEKLGFNVIMGMIPASNKFGLRYLERVGLKHLGVVEGLLWSSKFEAPVDGVILKISKGDL
jgi:RimJ/RimL family protein N-acetyltransferase